MSIHAPFQLPRAVVVLRDFVCDSEKEIATWAQWDSSICIILFALKWLCSPFLSSHPLAPDILFLLDFNKNRYREKERGGGLFKADIWSREKLFHYIKSLSSMQNLFRQKPIDQLDVHDMMDTCEGVFECGEYLHNARLYEWRWKAWEGDLHI